MTTSRLAALERVRPQSMAHTVGELGSAGLISRQADPSDRRQTLIAVTDDGKTAMEESRRVAERWASVAIGAELDVDEREALASALELLRRVLEHA